MVGRFFCLDLDRFLSSTGKVGCDKPSSPHSKSEHRPSPRTDAGIASVRSWKGGFHLVRRCGGLLCGLTKSERGLPPPNLAPHGLSGFLLRHPHIIWSTPAFSCTQYRAASHSRKPWFIRCQLFRVVACSGRGWHMMTPFPVVCVAPFVSSMP